MRKYKVLGVVSALLGFIACSDNATPIKLKGGAVLQLVDGSPISQTATDEYNPYVVKMPDGFLVLVFGSDRACGGCTAGNHNIFVSRSVAAYNDDQKIPAFNSAAVFTVASTPLNLSSAITFAVTKAGSNVRIYLNNAQGIIQYGDFLPTGGTFNVASLTSIVNAVWRRLTVVGIDELGSGIYGRSSSGQVYWINPAVINLTLTAMSGVGYTSVARVAPAQSDIQDSYFTLQNKTATAASYGASGEKLTKLQSAIDQAKVTAKALSIAHSGAAAGDFIVLSASESGKTTQDLYVADGLTPAQLWGGVSSKPASGIASLPAAATGIYAWYELDGNRNDASGSGNNAFLPTTPFNGVDPAYTGADRYGVPNSAATFNGTTQYVGNNFVAKCDESFSVSLWLKPAQIAAQRSVVGYQVFPAGNPGFTLNVDAGGAVGLQSFFATGFNASNLYGSGGALVVGQWSHITIVNDIATRRSTIYVNGTAVATTVPAVGGGATECSGSACTCAGSPPTGVEQWYTGTPMTIGYAYRGFFQGDLDQVAFYSRKLTAAEIQLLSAQ